MQGVALQSEGMQRGRMQGGGLHGGGVQGVVLQSGAIQSGLQGGAVYRAPLQGDLAHTELEDASEAVGAFAEAIADSVVGPPLSGMASGSSPSLELADVCVPHQVRGKVVYDLECLHRFSHLIVCPETLVGKFSDMECVAVRLDSSQAHSSQWESSGRLSATQPMGYGTTSAFLGSSAALDEEAGSFGFGSFRRQPNTRHPRRVGAHGEGN